MKTLYFDCFSGISGNMMIGALLDLGVPQEYFRSEIAKLNLSNYILNFDEIKKCGIRSTYFDVIEKHENEHSSDNSTENHHHNVGHYHRHLPDIIAIIDSSDFQDSIKERSKAVFYRLAQAEAKVHGVSVAEVHFHEVGAVDTIIDVVGTMICLEYLGIQQIYASKLHVGSGFIHCAHGVLPVPAPATAELLTGIPFYAKDIEKELVTPTGAALIGYLAESFGAKPDDWVSSKIGYGAGTWDLKIPNVLRVFLCDCGNKAPENRVYLIETNIDDMNPQIFGYVTEKLLSSGALDVWVTPIQMKKGRPGQVLSVITDEAGRSTMVDIILSETTSIGVRYQLLDRTIAERKTVETQGTWGMVRVKLSYFRGRLCSVTPEYDDCKLAAEQSGIPLKSIIQLVKEQALKIEQG